MSEQPASVAREAKNIHQSLKEALKTKEPFDRDVDFQRKNLRRRYLNLLLVQPNAIESKDVENHLWMQTSYAFISSYKQRILASDRAIQQNQRQQQQSHQSPPGRPNNYGIVEHRKLVNRFKQFLADEEKFWTQLILRLQRLFDLTEAQPALVALGLLTDTNDIRMVNGVEISETRDAVMHGAGGRNHHQFPPEDPNVSFVPTTLEEHENRLAILSKALICLGDIARYRELYSDNGKRAGNEDPPPRRSRNRRGGGPDLPPRPKTYDKARQCYEQARLLVPCEGNPSHQLAILSSYQEDLFSSLIHYYRALCVSQPYDTAAENLGTVLKKALTTWRQKSRKEKTDRSQNGTIETQLAPRVRVDMFKERVVILHALWRVGLDKGIEKMKSISPKHTEKVFHDFYTLISERQLPIDMISNTIVLSQGALWKHRMIRDAGTASRHNTGSSPVPEGTSTLIEWGLLDHLMDMHIALLEVGKDELKDPPIVDGIDDIAQRISAVFRRTLPALRIASKWLRANFKYVTQDQEFTAFQLKESSKGLEVKKIDPHKISGYSTKTLRFWETYAQFMLALSQAFPANRLPAMVAPLEEDIEMRGYLPLKKLMGEERRDEGRAMGSTGVGQHREQVHPNVEQLMRISDLLEDAKTVAKLENSPLLLINNHIIFNPEAVEEIRPTTHPEISQQISREASNTTQQLLATIRDNFPKRVPHLDEEVDSTGQIDDDPVKDAFLPNIMDDDQPDVVDDDDVEDEIVWDPRATVSPVLSPNIYATPLTPSKPLLSPKSISPRSPTHTQHARQTSYNSRTLNPPQSGTTAQDLLNVILPTNIRSPVGQVPSVSTAPQSQFTYDDKLSHRTTKSIWSATQDEQLLGYTNSRNAPSNQVYQTSPRSFSSLPGTQDLSNQSIWSSSFPNQTQNSQQSYVGTLPSASLAQPPHSKLTLGAVGERLPPVLQHHQRMSSLPLHQSHHDPFNYTFPVAQPPIHRPEHGLSPSLSGHLQLAQGSFGSPPQTYNMGHPIYQSSSLHDVHVPQHNYMPPVSQVWGNTG